MLDGLQVGALGKPRKFLRVDLLDRGVALGLHHVGQSIQPPGLGEVVTASCV
jgi:hypothetical protein